MTSTTLWSLLMLLLVVANPGDAQRDLSFPEGFMFGAASASYQVEGAWNTSGKGENIWDRLTHEHPELIEDHSNGDIAADSYHKYREDVQAAKDIGLNMYRFSISWARIMPQGDVSVINQDGLNYYNNLINDLLANNITPVVTMYHWDLPQHLQDLGGMVNSIFVDYFEDYARLLYTQFGDRVKWWVTFNEPEMISWGYSRPNFAPSVSAPGVGDYLAIHNLLKAHAVAYRLYDRHFRRAQNGKVGITLSASWAVPKTQSEADIEAAERYLQFTVGWFAHPIFSKEGDYPSVMKERIANNSRAEGLYRSRLPEFSKYWINYIRGTHDFFGLNTYNAILVAAPTSPANSSEISFDDDMGNLETSLDPSWPTGGSPIFAYTPFGMRKMLKWISDEYDCVDILITENGWCDNGELNDTMRIRYIVNYLAATLDAVHQDNVSVLGYTVWSLIDNFQWASGYSIKFGIYYVDFSDDSRPRVAKQSARGYSSIISNRHLPDEYLDSRE